MIHEEIYDAGEIIANILNKPLHLPHLPDDLTLLSAALQFKDEDPATSALASVLDALEEHPESKELLLRELEIIAEELES